MAPGFRHHYRLADLSAFPCCVFACLVSYIRHMWTSNLVDGKSRMNRVAVSRAPFIRRSSRHCWMRWRLASGCRMICCPANSSWPTASVSARNGAQGSDELVAEQVLSRRQGRALSLPAIRMSGGRVGFVLQDDFAAHEFDHCKPNCSVVPVPMPPKVWRRCKQTRCGSGTRCGVCFAHTRSGGGGRGCDPAAGFVRQPGFAQDQTVRRRPCTRLYHQVFSVRVQNTVKWRACRQCGS